LSYSKAEADAIDEAGLLMEAAEAEGGIDDLVFFFERFAGHGLIKFVESLLDLVGA